jgi:hypothetical protein
MGSILEVLVRLLELLFAVGCCGSVIVILLSGIEDVETIFSHDEPPPVPTVQVEKQG